MRDYLRSEQPLMAADIIFTEGSDAAATAGRQVETARLAEHQAFDRYAADMRRQQAITIGAAAAVLVLVVLLLIPIRRVPAVEDSLDATTSSYSIAPSQSPPRAAAAPAESSSPTTGALFNSAADLRHRLRPGSRPRGTDADSGRAADLLDASGLMVWIGTTLAGIRRPVLAHGYSSQMIARIPPVPRSADNAAATAYRTGALQIVLSRPGVSSGAVVAPILSADGCIGALSAEIRGGGETSEGRPGARRDLRVAPRRRARTTPAAEIAETAAQRRSITFISLRVN